LADGCFTPDDAAQDGMVHATHFSLDSEWLPKEIHHGLFEIHSFFVDSRHHPPGFEIRVTYSLP